MPESKVRVALKFWVPVGRQALVLGAMLGALASCSNLSRPTSAFAPWREAQHG